MTEGVLPDTDRDEGHRTFVVDQVQIHHFPSQDTVCHATLLFMAGERDETLATHGTLHALEHLVMDALRRTPIEINAEVDRDTTQFVASGSPRLVADFLAGVCAQLQEPPLDRLEHEKSVLAAEMRDVGHPGGPLLTARYGWRDAGLADCPGPGPEGATAAAVRDLARRWFRAANAVLLVDGPWPSDLRLPLPGGPLPERSWPAPRRWERPHAVTVDGAACAVSLILPPESASRRNAVIQEVVEARLTEALRHLGGLSYVVESEVFPVAGQLWDLVLHAEPPPAQAIEAARVLIAAVTELLAAGPTEEELDFARERVHERYRGREAGLHTVVVEAIAARSGVQFPRLDPADLQSLSRDEIAACLRDLAGNVLFLVSDDSEKVLNEFQIPQTPIAPLSTEPLPPGRTFRPPTLTRLLNSEARRSTIVLADDGLWLVFGDEVEEIRWPQVAGVMRIAEDELVVFGVAGNAIPIGGALYRDGQVLIDTVLSRVPPTLVYQQSALLADPDRDDR